MPGPPIENARLYEQARKDAEMRRVLLREVNHRVKNNLAAIIGFLYAERRHTRIRDDAVYQDIMQDLVNRVQGMGTVHGMLSAVEWSPLLLSDLVRRVINSSLQMLPRQKSIRVTVDETDLRIPAEQAHNLALVINETGDQHRQTRPGGAGRGDHPGKNLPAGRSGGAGIPRRRAGLRGRSDAGRIGRFPRRLWRHPQHRAAQPGRPVGDWRTGTAR